MKIKLAILVFVMSLVSWATVFAQEEIRYAVPDDDMSFIVSAEPGIVNCNTTVDRFAYFYDTPETPEEDDYYVAIVNWELPVGEFNCFADYEIYGQHLYAIRATRDFTCEVEFSRIYCWKVIYEATDLLIYGRQPDTAWDFKPTMFSDSEGLDWVFFYFSSFLGIVTK